MKINHKSYVIYGLIDPNTYELRYVGYSSNKEERFKSHHDPEKLIGHSHKQNWIKSLLAKGQKAEMFVIEEIDMPDNLSRKEAKKIWAPIEIELIAYYKYIGCNLTNGTKGGDGGGGNLSPETKNKISRSKIGKSRPKKIGENLRNCFLGKKQTNRQIVSASKYVGISFKKKRKRISKWTCQIRNKFGKRIYLGYFLTEVDAAEAYNKIALELYGNEAILNNITVEDKLVSEHIHLEADMVKARYGKYSEECKIRMSKSKLKRYSK